MGQPLDWRMAIVDSTGKPSPEFQRLWNLLNLTIGNLDTEVNTLTTNLSTLTTKVNTIGSYLTSVILLAGAISLVTATPKNITSITLTPGIWDVTGNVFFHPAGTTITTSGIAAINLVTTALPTAPDYAKIGSAIAGIDTSVVSPTTRISVTVNTPVYLVAQATFTTSTMTAYGRIRATLVNTV